MTLTEKYMILKDFFQKTDHLDSSNTNITGSFINAALNTVKNKIPNVGDLVKKQIMMQKYLILRLNILTYLIVINLQMKYLMQR